MKLSLAILLLFFSSHTYAMFCPNNFNQINIGDTIESVKQQCGKPNTEKKSTEEDDSGPQEWNYYVTPSTPGYTQPITGGQSATVKMAIALNNNKIVNITVNGMSLASSGMCGGNVDAVYNGKIISVGDSAKELKAACGEPVFINKSSQTNQKPPTIEVITFTYSSTPPVTLIFKNGKLTEKQ